MSCYHPLVGLFDGTYTDKGRKHYKIQAGVCVNDLQPSMDYILVPCGHCIGCRLSYSRFWADRMMLELETAGKAVFLTMTYDEAHAHPIEYVEAVPSEGLFPQRPLEVFDGGKYLLPVSWNLDYRDVQLFMKRLRKSLDGVKVRFFCSGEYGEKTGRPHYHMILFGYGLADFPDLELWSKNVFGNPLYVSKWMNRVWKNGRVLIGDVSWKTCAYVARYVTKKLSGPQSITYSVLNREKEKSLMSRRPGLGAEYLIQHPDCLDYTHINLATPEGGVKIPIPKYYLQCLEKEKLEGEVNPLWNPGRYDILIQERMDMAKDNFLLKMQKTGLSYEEYLSVEEGKKLEQVKVLKRHKV